MEQRTWRQCRAPDPTAATSFTVMSYNILADALCQRHPELYDGCSPKALHWDQRFRSIMQNIVSRQPSVVCLQEVQPDHFLDFERQLRTSGYTGHYTEKGGEATVDGCAIFVKDAEFAVEMTIDIRYRIPECPVLNRPNVGQAVLLTCQSTARPLWVANSHLLFNPQRGDIKLMQIGMLLATVAGHSKERFGPQRWLHVPTVVAGDFNCTPSSPIIAEFMLNGELWFCGRAAAKMSGQSTGNRSRREMQPHDLFPPSVDGAFSWLVSDRCAIGEETEAGVEVCDRPCHAITHPFSFHSAYEHPGNGHHFPSTVHNDVCGTVDYLFAHKLDCIAVQPLLSIASIDRGQLPSLSIPSDHQFLLARFQW